MVNLINSLWSRFLHFARPSKRVAPVALPRHPDRGLRVEKGDTFSVKNMSISLHDAVDVNGTVSRPFQVRVPPWADAFIAGATFGLTQRLEEGWFNIDENRIAIVEGGWTLEVALKSNPTDLLNRASALAERTLDLLAASSYLVADIHDPLREHALWYRESANTTLRVVTTGRLYLSMKMEAEVRDASGALKPQPTYPPQRWHASHAYFRRSQTTDNLHDAYRNLFLAFESLLSEVYPWDFRDGEVRWLKSALKYVIEGYSLDLKEYVGGTGGNPYNRFIKEQYRAKRCALFHAKLSESPMLPGDVATRDELLDATRRLGRLYVQLAQLITGASFAGGGATYAAFEMMSKAVMNSPMYVSERADFDLDQVVRTSAQSEPEAGDHPTVHVVRGTWRRSELPSHISRAGSILVKDTGSTEGMFVKLNLSLAGVDTLEVVYQNEWANARGLRTWYI